MIKHCTALQYQAMFKLKLEDNKRYSFFIYMFISYIVLHRKFAWHFVDGLFWILFFTLAARINSMQSLIMLVRVLHTVWIKLKVSWINRFYFSSSNKMIFSFISIVKQMSMDLFDINYFHFEKKKMISMCLFSQAIVTTAWYSVQTVSRFKQRVYFV